MSKSIAFSVIVLNVIAIMTVHSYELSGAITGCHDPSQIVEENGVFHIYSTAENLNHRTSTDLFEWTWANKPFSYAQGVPEYIRTWCVNGTDAAPWNIWAPEIRRVGNQWQLFISRNCPRTVNGVYQEQSIVGLHTNSSLAQTGWMDNGAVLSVDLNTVGFRVIDPALHIDQSGQHWLAVGSFGSSNTLGFQNGGIRLFAIDAATGKLKNANDLGTRIAGPWIEAPYLHFHNEYYWLFFNERRCCEGLNSTYFIRVGRSRNINGPYVDMDGTNLNQGGGTLFSGLDYAANYTDENRTKADKHGRVGKELGPGHMGIFRTRDSIDLFTYHYYDSSKVNGEPTLGMRSLVWGEDGWPRFGWNLVDGVYAMVNRENSENENGKAWQVTRVGPNMYRFMDLASNLSLASKSLESYVPAQARFHWRLLQHGDRSFSLRNLADASVKRYWIVPTGNFRIRNQWSGQWLQPASSLEGADVVQQSTASQWSLQPTLDGYVKIIQSTSQMAMQTKTIGTADGTAIVVRPSSSDFSQQWSAELLPDSSWRFINRASGKPWEVSTKNTAERLVQRRWLSTRNQQWALEFVSAPDIPPVHIDPTVGFGSSSFRANTKKYNVQGRSIP